MTNTYAYQRVEKFLMRYIRAPAHVVLVRTNVADPNSERLQVGVMVSPDRIEEAKKKLAEALQVFNMPIIEWLPVTPAGVGDMVYVEAVSH